jgi:hypothetical protein
MVNYSNGKIYKLVCNITDLTYIGSTTSPLAVRKSGHRSDYNKYTLGKTPKKVTSSLIIENGDYDIILIESCPCDTKEELLSRERHFIESMTCVNRNIPSRSAAEYRETFKEYYALRTKENREANKDAINQKDRDIYASDASVRERNNASCARYLEQNRDSINARKQRYREANREKLRDKQREYYENNSVLINERARMRKK